MACFTCEAQWPQVMDSILNSIMVMLRVDAANCRARAAFALPSWQGQDVFFLVGLLTFPRWEAAA